jgi:decaprenylphospho-beta-D-erythro-pentofuranosid-2-ulose 2-reductase
MTVVIVGASGGLGRAVVERFAAHSEALILVARDRRDLARLAAHMDVCHGCRCVPVAGDLRAPETLLRDIKTALAEMPTLRGLIVLAGAVDDNDQPAATEVLDTLVRVNFLGPATLISGLIAELRRVPDPFVIGVGSVASMRGRRRNGAYAASKRAMISYFESLAHFGWSWGLRTQYYIAGYLDTNMAWGRKVAFTPADPVAFAELMYKNRRKEAHIAFYPARWRWISLFVRAIPWRIFRKWEF